MTCQAGHITATLQSIVNVGTSTHQMARRWPMSRARSEPPGKETQNQCLWLQGPSASPTPASWPSGMERTERICSLFVLAVIGCTTQALDGPSINNGMVGWMGWVKRKEVGRLGGGLMDGRISSFGETDRLTDRISICGSQPLRLKR